MLSANPFDIFVPVSLNLIVLAVIIHSSKINVFGPYVTIGNLMYYINSTLVR